MVLVESLIREAEARFGVPVDLTLEAALDPSEIELVSGSLRKSRVHDITLFIVDRDELVVIRKPQFSPDVFRAPSGGVHAGETLEQGALREGYEETGLDLRLERYVMRVNARFRPRPGGAWGADLPAEVRSPGEPDLIRWWTHVFLAVVVGDRTLDPKDRIEIAEARWVTIDELQGSIRDALLRTGRPLFGYRVALTDATVAALARGPGA